MIYYFFSKTDSKKEPISKIECNNYEEALSLFSKIKRLPKKIFLELYEIITKPSDARN
jgi:hypothetical protein